ncbi:hypothetical protein NP493_3430g00001 [Ridgeia piscesae]|uniref:AP-5 complex subunit zeta-1 C-terminal TPR domain-containing protein n=1 Tax=Ridgeia piscesae TaxID=27915 RepID=A0AAD9MX87_RIDPI|nr:hypothetical protein NP493_3430g00001 [Ridgeia piscesae]
MVTPAVTLSLHYSGQCSWCHLQWHCPYTTQVSAHGDTCSDIVPTLLSDIVPTLLRSVLVVTPAVTLSLHYSGQCSWCHLQWHCPYTTQVSAHGDTCSGIVPTLLSGIVPTLLMSVLMVTPAVALSLHYSGQCSWCHLQWHCPYTTQVSAHGDTCSGIVPTLLSVFFGACVETGSCEVASRLVPVILERAGLLFGSQQHQLQISKTLGEGLLLLFRMYPSILMEQWEEVREYVGNSGNVANREEFFTHVVWSVGEYLTPSYNVHCTPDVMAKLYETLEILAYEISRSRHSSKSTETPVFSARLCSVLMTAVAKLGARLQDLIPRAILCLTKLGGQGSQEDVSLKALAERAVELIGLLQLPNVAALILNPPAHLKSAGWHTDGSTLPAILRVTSMHLQHQGDGEWREGDCKDNKWRKNNRKHDMQEGDRGESDSGEGGRDKGTGDERIDATEERRMEERK